jgi:hypothetical protein
LPSVIWWLLTLAIVVAAAEAAAITLLQSPVWSGFGPALATAICAGLLARRWAPNWARRVAAASAAGVVIGFLLAPLVASAMIAVGSRTDPSVTTFIVAAPWTQQLVLVGLFGAMAAA